MRSGAIWVLLAMWVGCSAAWADHRISGDIARELYQGLADAGAVVTYTPAGPEIRVSRLDCSARNFALRGSAVHCALTLGDSTTDVSDARAGILLNDLINVGAVGEGEQGSELNSVVVTHLQCQQWVVPGANEGTFSCSFEQ